MNRKTFATIFIVILFSFGLFMTPTFAAVKVGAPAPDFSLQSVDGKKVNLSDYKGKIVVLEWFNPDCPFVQKHYKSNHMQELQSTYTSKGVVWLTINSTNPNHENFRDPAKALDEFKSLGMKSTSLLADPTGNVGKEFGAKSTPHMYIIDQQGNLAYVGAIDDTPSPNSDPAKAKNYVQQALDELLSGKPVSISQTKQYGCGIKYSK